MMRQWFKDLIDKKYSDWDISIALRYLPIVEDIGKNHKKGEKILELGSEITGITTYLKKQVTGLDTDFDYSRRNKFLKPVKGSVIKIPFTDRSFEYVVSVDMLEHIPPELRKKAIEEMTRVTKKKLYLAFPCGERSAKIDRELNRYYKKKHGVDYQYLQEHVSLGLPKEEEVVKHLKSQRGFAKLEIKPNTNILIWNLLLKWGLSGEKLKSQLYRRLLLAVPLLKYFNFGTTYRKIFVMERV